MLQKAQPVWAEYTDVNQYLDFYQAFEAKATDHLQLYIRCHSNYVAWINGYLIGFGQYPDYEEYRVADYLSIPNTLLRDGKNILAVLAYCQNEDSSTYRKGTPSLIFELREQGNTIAASGKQTLVREEPCYQSGRREKLSGQLGFTFSYDNRAADSWQTAATPLGFRRAELLPSGGKYYRRPIKKTLWSERCPSRLVATGDFRCENRDETTAERIYHAFLRTHSFHATDLGAQPLLLSAAEGTDGIYAIIDLQKECAGCIELEFDAEEACLVDIGYGEQLDDLRVRSFVGGRHFGCSYYATKGSNCFTHYLTRAAGRYLQLHFYTSRVTLRYAGLHETPYPLRKTVPPQGLDSLEQKIYAVGADTLRLCMHEHYEDCPWREQALYAMDARTQMLAGYAAFREHAFPKASLRLLGLGLRSDGLLELCAPARVPLVIPTFSLMWLISLQEYVAESGDLAFGKEWMPTAKRIMDTFEQQKENELITLFSGEGAWNFYEWSDGLDGDLGHPKKGTDSLINLFYAYALQKYALLAEALGEVALQRQTKKIYTELKEAINREFRDEAQGGYCISHEDRRCPELAQALAVISGVAGKHRRQLIRGLVNRRFFPQATLSSKIFTYDALLTEPSVYPSIRREVKEIWGKMLFAGATSFWETEKGADDFEEAGSLCHGWSAVPVYLYRRLEAYDKSLTQKKQ